jgi:lipid II:glycine glycyltransferase (peptidoglycan interpeptide bridge formation enzyme)
LVATRKRHRVPPQPKAWFRNLIHAFGDRLTIRLARFGRVPVAAILTLRHKATVTYKYGASDTRWNRLGGMQLLLWRTIEQAKQEGMERLDLGRSDIGQTGLITFKDRWGASRLPLRYFRFSQAEQSVARYASGSPDWRMRALERSVAFLPDATLPLLGRIVGRHVG